jgi:apolipoprotein N-acyltransferase
MYCSTCGKSLNDNLNYCNNCGTRVENKAVKVRNGSPMLGIGAVFVGIVGLICFVPLLRELLFSRLEQWAVIAILVAYLLTVLAMFAVLIGHVWKKSGDIRINGAQGADEYQTQAAIQGINTAQLQEPREPVMSVTEHTTRTLDKIPSADR